MTKEKTIILVLPETKTEEPSNDMGKLTFRPGGFFDAAQDAVVYQAIIRATSSPIDRNIFVSRAPKENPFDDVKDPIFVRASEDSMRTAFAEVLTLAMNGKLSAEDALAAVDAGYAEYEKVSKMLAKYQSESFAIRNSAAMVAISEKVTKAVKPLLAKPEVNGLVSIVPMDECFCQLQDLEMLRTPFVIAKGETDFAVLVNNITDKKNKFRGIDALKIKHILDDTLGLTPVRTFQYGDTYAIEEFDNYVAAINVFNGVTSIDGKVIIDVTRKKRRNSDKVILADGKEVENS